MRYRYSLWDVVIALAGGTNLLGAWWVMTTAEGPVPLHWDASGVPDRWGEVSAAGLLMLPLIALAFYLFFRLLDSYYAARKPGAYGFLTNLGGGMTLAMALLAGMHQMATLYPQLRMPVLPVIGLMIAYIGWQLKGAPPEVALNTAGIVPETPEARATVLSTLGGGMTLIGFASGLLGFLPGSWSLLSVGVLVIGPLAVTVVALVRGAAR